MNNFSLIAAVTTPEWGIGNAGKLPWYPEQIKLDMEFFKAATSKIIHLDNSNSLFEDVPTGKYKAVIMGRKTWDSIPKKFRPLAGRINLIVTSSALASEEVENKHVIAAKSLDEALFICKNSDQVYDVTVCGGARLYEEAIEHPLCRAALITEVTHPGKTLACDTFFPKDCLKKNFSRVRDITDSVANHFKSVHPHSMFVCKFMVYGPK